MIRHLLNIDTTDAILIGGVCKSFIVALGIEKVLEFAFHRPKTSRFFFSCKVKITFEQHCSGRDHLPRICFLLRYPTLVQDDSHSNLKDMHKMGLRVNFCNDYILYNTTYTYFLKKF